MAQRRANKHDVMKNQNTKLCPFYAYTCDREEEKETKGEEGRKGNEEN